MLNVYPVLDQYRYYGNTYLYEYFTAIIKFTYEKVIVLLDAF
jgi:hypothetical protein